MTTDTIPTWRKIVDFPLVALLIVTIVIMAVFGGLTLLFLQLDLPFSKDGALVFNACLSAVIAFLIAKFIVPRLGEEKRDDFAWPGGGRWLAIGIAGAGVLMTAIVAVVALLGGYTITGWGGMTGWPTLLFLAGVQAGVLEEVVFRGVLFRYLEQFAGSWFALAFTSALFGLAHITNQNATWFSSLAIAVEAGVMLGAAYMLARNLWLPVGLHFGWNVTQGFVWDVPVSGFDADGLVRAQPLGPELISGGAFGVEASVVALVLAGAVGAWLTVRAARAGHIMRPWWTRRRLALAGAPTTAN